MEKDIGLMKDALSSGKLGESLVPEILANIPEYIGEVKEPYELEGPKDVLFTDFVDPDKTKPRLIYIRPKIHKSNKTFGGQYVDLEFWKMMLVLSAAHDFDILVWEPGFNEDFSVIKPYLDMAAIYQR